MTQFAWLIEAPGRKYLTVRNKGRFYFYWTDDPYRAIRFVDKYQCEFVASAIKELSPDLFTFEPLPGVVRVVEHGFAEAAASPKPPEEG